MATIDKWLLNSMYGHKIMKPELIDERIVFGTNCSWWDNVSKASDNQCPHCGGRLYQVPSEQVWWEQVVGSARARGTAFANVQLQQWLRGRACYDSLVNANTAYEVMNEEA